MFRLNFDSLVPKPFCKLVSTLMWVICLRPFVAAGAFGCITSIRAYGIRFLTDVVFDFLDL